MKTFTLTYNNRSVLKSGYTYYPSENLGPINTWTIPSTTTDVVSYSSEDTIKLNGKGGHYETCYKAFSVEKTGTYTISYDYNLPTVNFYGTDSNHMYFGIFITTNQPPGGDMGTWSAYSTGNCNGYVICGPSSQYNSPGEGHAQFNYNLTAGTTYYLWVPMMNLADGVVTYLTFTNLKWTDTESITVPDYKAKTNIYDLEILTAEHGTCIASNYSGLNDDIISVTATPDEGWYHIGYDITGSVITGNDFKFLNNDVNLEPIFSETESYPITYLSDEHVQCTGDTQYIPGSTGITLVTSYDPYYRISGYEVTGGTIENGVLIPTGSCIVKAVEKVNYFTATGGWEHGSNVEATARSNVRQNTVNVPQKYAIHGAHTGDIPATWYSNSNRWNVNSQVSSYSITMNPKMSFYRIINGSTLSWTDYGGVSLIGNTTTASQNASWQGGNSYRYYDQTFTTNTTGVTYGISAWVHAWGYDGGGSRSNYATARYVASETNGTWTATGIAP